MSIKIAREPQVDISLETVEEPDGQVGTGYSLGRWAGRVQLFSRRPEGDLGRAPRRPPGGG